MMHDARCTIGPLEFFHSILVNFENLENLVNLVNLVNLENLEILPILQY